MKLILVVAFACLLVVVNAADKYTDRWDNINIDEVLESDRLLRKYVDCLLDKGRCAPDAKALKEVLPDALETNCAKCTKKQKDGSTKVLRHFVNKRKDLWDQLAKKYDPNGTYAEKYRDDLKKEGITL